MKKILTGIMFVLVFAICAGCFNSNALDVRYEAGEIYSFYDTANQDTITTLVQKENGQMIAIADFVAPRFSKCVLVYDTNGTEQTDDDILLQIIVTTNFN